MMDELGMTSYWLSISSPATARFGEFALSSLWEMEPADVIFDRAVAVPEEGAFGGKVCYPPRTGLKRVRSMRASKVSTLSKRAFML